MAIIGAILGDIIGSTYEFKKPDSYDYTTSDLFTKDSHFTDETVLSIATALAVIHGRSFADAYRWFGKLYAKAGYGDMFEDWLSNPDKTPYNSYGNGSAMRVSFVADYYDSFLDVQDVARQSASCTHNHAEGIKGAIVTATCIWMAKHGFSKDDILAYVIACYPIDKYAFSPFLSLDEMRHTYKWSASCQNSVPVAMRCVYEADSFEHFMRNVLSLDCDADTIGAIGGSIAEELYNNEQDSILKNKHKYMKQYLDNRLHYMLYAVLEEASKR